MAKNRSGLGRGLGALMGDPVPRPSHQADKSTVDGSAAEERSVESSAEGMTEQSRAEKEQAAKVLEEKEAIAQAEEHVVIKEVKTRNPSRTLIDKIVPNPDQPRTSFKKEELEELADSIKQNGLLQPIVVRQVGDTFQIIAGERRWQASRLAGLTEVPISVLEADDDKAIELAMIENIQRSDLNPIEEAYGYRRLMERKGLTQSQLAQLVSKGRSTIANSLRLLELPEQAQQLLFEEKITAGHARAVLSIPTAEGRQQLTDKLVEGKMTVREAENLARLIAGKAEKADKPARPQVPKEYRAAAKNLGRTLDTKVRVKVSGGKNRLEIEFADQEQLEAIIGRISADQE